MDPRRRGVLRENWRTVPARTITQRPGRHDHARPPRLRPQLLAHARLEEIFWRTSHRQAKLSTPRRSRRLSQISRRSLPSLSQGNRRSHDEFAGNVRPTNTRRDRPRAQDAKEATAKLETAAAALECWWSRTRRQKKKSHPASAKCCGTTTLLVVPGFSQGTAASKRDAGLRRPALSSSSIPLCTAPTSASSSSSLLLSSSTARVLPLPITHTY